MTISDEILVNQYGQNLIEERVLLNHFLACDLVVKRAYLQDLIMLIVQSKPQKEDISLAISMSSLKSTFTPCVLLKKGVASYQLQKIASLPTSELGKVLILLLNLFKIAYQRRFKVEENSPYKWWYWDLSDEERVAEILNGSFKK